MHRRNRTYNPAIGFGNFFLAMGTQATELDSRTASGGRIQFLMKTYSIGCIAIVLLLKLGFAGCATTGVSASATLADYVAEADTAYHNLPASLSAYNCAVRQICDVMQTGNPEEFAASLHKIGVSFNSPQNWTSVASCPDCRALSRVKPGGGGHSDGG